MPGSPTNTKYYIMATVCLLLVACSSPKTAKYVLPGEEREGYFAVDVLFATDRAPKTGGNLEFTGQRGDGNLIYGDVTVSIPDIHRKGEMESPGWHPWGRKNPQKYVLVLERKKIDGPQVFVKRTSDLLSEIGQEDILLFLHGYNNDFEDAARRTAQIAYDLDFKGVPMFFSWPSMGKVNAYPADEGTIEWSTLHFKDFLQFVLKDVNARYVNVIAHSMGNRALVQALKDFDASTLPPDSAKLRQIILAAPDIDADLFKQLAANFHGKAERITVYSSENDKAILASRIFHSYPRAGGTVVVVDGVDTIDASAVETDFTGHAYYGDSILPDIFSLIINNLSPAQRYGLRAISSPDGDYWELAPGAY